MKSQRLQLLFHPLFILSLFLLLLNDLYLKYTYHNWFTGKLSDFSGLLAFSIFLVACLPFKRAPILIFVTLFFIWWKSPLSNGFIHYLNYKLDVPAGRTVDYSDLTSLFILPLCYFIKPGNYKNIFGRNILIPVSGFTALFCFCATSILPRQIVYYSYRDNETRFGYTYATSLPYEEILRKLDILKIGVKADSSRYYKVTSGESLYMRVSSEDDSLKKWIKLPASTDSGLYVKREQGLFYTIPKTVVNGDTLIDMEFTIHTDGNKKRPNIVTIESFLKNNPTAFFSKEYIKTERGYNKYFKTLFK